MNKTNHLIRICCTLLCAALMAGCSACLAARSPGFAVFWPGTYAMAIAAAAVVQLGRRSLHLAIGAGAALVLGLGALLAKYGSELAAMVRTLAESGAQAACAAQPSAGTGLALLLALALGALFAWLLHAPSGAPFTLLVLVAVMITALTVNPDISLWAALPGLMAGVAAFGLPGDARRDGVRPALMLPAAVLALLALLASPSDRTTWAPMENLAEQVRSVVEDYIRFTEERIAFSINEKGYDHAGMIGENVVAMLGGPADPADDAVMRVQADGELLLRGTIKRSYTGYSWVDDVPKARYLYYDFTHRGVRSDAFDSDSTARMPGFKLRSGRAEMLAGGTSTLFVPGQMAEFDMSLADAVYYNSAGELFLTREVQAGDSYAFAARVHENDAALVSAAAVCEGVQDDRYQRALEEYTALPEGVDSRVYALAVELTRNGANTAEKALAIQEHLARNYHYTLDGRYPDGGKDFVSWFLLEEKQGYCSYFASSMAVLCRIAGIPARYIEGYYIPGAGEHILTGEHAHAWVEVYLNGLGWVALDPTARSREVHGDVPGEEGYSDHGVDREGGDESPFEGDDSAGPAPTPTADVGSDPDPTPEGDLGMNNPESTPTPNPDGGDGGGQDDSALPEPESDPPAPRDNPDTDGNDDSPSAWIWVLLALILLAIIALAALWVRKRLADSDPLVLCASVKSAGLAAMILYRGNLTLLAQLGLAPMNGETPGDFARRASAAMPNPAYERFVEGVVTGRYSGKPLTREILDSGRQAYAVFLGGMRWSEKLRFCVHRVFRGLGSFENIP